MFCIHCGTQNTDGNRFCIKCGQPLEQPGPAGEQPDAWQAPPQQDWAAPQAGGQTTQQDWAQPQTGGQPTQQDWAEPQTGGQPAQQDWAEPQTGGQPAQQDWAEPQTGGQPTQQDWAEPNSFTGGSAPTGTFQQGGAAEAAQTAQQDWVAPAPAEPVQQDWAGPQTGGQTAQQDWAEPQTGGQPTQQDWAESQTGGQATQQDWAEPQTGGQATQQDWADPNSFTGDSVPTGEAAWPGDQEPTGERWAPFPDDPAQPSGSDWESDPGQGMVGTATQDTIVRNGTWSSSELVTPPPAPVPAAGGRGRPALVIALCAATALCAAGTLTYLLLRDKLVAAQAPAFSIFIPIALGGAALIFAAAAVLVILTGRQPVQQVVEDTGSYAPDTYQPAPPASAGIPVTLTDTARPGEPFQLLLEGPVVIGRVQEECDLALPYEKSVSKRHCRIYPSQGTVYVEDLGGRNGTYLNGTQVVVPTSLHSGDMIKLGRLVLRVDIG